MESALSSPEISADVKSASAAATNGARTTRRKAKRGRIPRLKRWTAIMVSWLDAVTENGPQNSDSEFQCPTRHSIGHFIKRNGESITIAMEDDRGVDESSDCDTVTSIPLGMVRKVTVLVPRVD
jgi:hypothetical protein